MTDPKYYKIIKKTKELSAYHKCVRDELKGKTWKNRLHWMALFREVIKKCKNRASRR